MLLLPRISGKIVSPKLQEDTLRHPVMSARTRYQARWSITLPRLLPQSRPGVPGGRESVTFLSRLGPLTIRFLLYHFESVGVTYLSSIIGRRVKVRPYTVPVVSDSSVRGLHYGEVDTKPSHELKELRDGIHLSLSANGSDVVIEYDHVPEVMALLVLRGHDEEFLSSLL